MKKILLASIICVLSASANQVHALSYKDVLPQNNSIQKLSSAQISEANILQLSVHRYKLEINDLYNTYSNKQSSVMIEANKLLNQMSHVLSEIQNDNLDPLHVDEVMKSIIDDLRKFNTGMKAYLEQEKIIFEKNMKKIKHKYIVLGEKISSILDKIISDLTLALLKKETLTEKEKEIVRNLVTLRNENNKIKQFESVFFKSEEEIQIYFKNIITKIRSSLLNIRSLAR